MADKNFAMTEKGIKLMLAGLVVIIAGFILLAGGGVKDPAVFNYDMFDFRRLVAAPVVMVCGIIVVIVGIMNRNEAEK